MKKSMLAVEKIVDWDSVVLHLTVHNELDLSVPLGAEGDRWIAEAVEIMQDFPLTVPIIADAEVGEDWGHVKEWRAPWR